MYARYVDQIPEPLELERVVQGFRFEDFKQLSDEEVEALYQEMLDSQGNTDIPDESYWERVHFKQFIYWRRQGIPDYNMTSDEFFERVMDSLKHKIASNPGFGFIDPIKHSQLPENTRAAIVRSIKNLLRWKEVSDYRLDVFTGDIEHGPDSSHELHHRRPLQAKL